MNWPPRTTSARRSSAALAASQFLIVLCSPDAAQVALDQRRDRSLQARLGPTAACSPPSSRGEPFASDIPGREDEECFPPALRTNIDRRGRPTGKRAEPLAADLRDDGDGRRLGFLKLVAGMLGVGLDDLVQRDTTRRHRRLAWLAGGSLAGMAVTSTLAVTAIQARDAARDQRREAEGLVAFMLGDLKDKLEPIGRLDALDGVGARVLAYYSKQDASEPVRRRLAAALAGAQPDWRKSPICAAISTTAERLYREAMAGTGGGDPARSRRPAAPVRPCAERLLGRRHRAATRATAAGAEARHARI